MLSQFNILKLVCYEGIVIYCLSRNEVHLSLEKSLKVFFLRKILTKIERNSTKWKMDTASHKQHISSIKVLLRGSTAL